MVLKERKIIRSNLFTMNSAVGYQNSNVISALRYFKHKSKTVFFFTLQEGNNKMFDAT